MPKLSDLDEKLTPDSVDYLPVVDVEGGITKKIKIGNLGVVGPQGPAGPQGDPGAPGNQGNTGDTGDKGDKGDKGDAGDPLSVAAAYPIGSVFLSVVSTNPNTLLGIGTWALIAQGQLLAGFKAGDADYGTVEGTGGNKTATPDAHAGGEVTRAVSGVTVSNHGDHVHSDAHTHDIAHAHGTSGRKIGTSSATITDATLGATASGARSAANTGNPTAALTHSVVEPNAGAGHGHGFTQPGAHAAMSILNPFFVVYVWKRTA